MAVVFLFMQATLPAVPVSRTSLHCLAPASAFRGAGDADAVKVRSVLRGFAGADTARSRNASRILSIVKREGGARPEGESNEKTPARRLRVRTLVKTAVFLGTGLVLAAWSPVVAAAVGGGALLYHLAGFLKRSGTRPFRFAASERGSAKIGTILTTAVLIAAVLYFGIHLYRAVRMSPERAIERERIVNVLEEMNRRDIERVKSFSSKNELYRYIAGLPLERNELGGFFYRDGERWVFHLSGIGDDHSVRVMTDPGRDVKRTFHTHTRSGMDMDPIYVMAPSWTDIANFITDDTEKEMAISLGYDTVAVLEKPREWDKEHRPVIEAIRLLAEKRLDEFELRRILDEILMSRLPANAAFDLGEGDVRKELHINSWPWICVNVLGIEARSVSFSRDGTANVRTPDSLNSEERRTMLAPVSGDIVERARELAARGGPLKMPGTDEDEAVFPRKTAEEIFRGEPAEFDPVWLGRVFRNLGIDDRKALDNETVRLYFSDRLPDTMHAYGETTREEGRKILRVIVNRRYLNPEARRERYLVRLAEILDHEWTENMLGRGHRGASMRQRELFGKTPSGESALTPYHEWVLGTMDARDLDRLIREYETLSPREKTRRGWGDYEALFHRKAKETLANHRALTRKLEEYSFSVRTMDDLLSLPFSDLFHSFGADWEHPVVRRFVLRESFRVTMISGGMDGLAALRDRALGKAA